MTACRVRVDRDTPASGAFEWVTLDRQGRALASGAASLAQSPVAGECEVVLASELVLLDRVAVQPSAQRRLGSALRYLAEELALPDPERLHVAAAPGPERSSLCLAIVDRQWLEELLDKLRSANLAAASVYPESLLPTLMPRTWTVVWKGNDGFVRTGENEAFTLDAAEQGTVPVALKLALGHARASGGGPQAIVVRCFRQAEPPDVGAWSTLLGIPVEQGPEWDWTDAQRSAELDLLQGEFAARRGVSPVLQRLRRPAIMAAALLTLGSFAIAIDWAAKVHERRALAGEMLAVFRETFGENAVVVDAPLQMTRALADLRQQAGRIGPADFPALLALATEHLPDSTRHRIDGIAYENGVLTVTLRPAAGQQPAVLLRELRAKAPPPAYELLLDEAQSSGTITLRLRPRRGT